MVTKVIIKGGKKKSFKDYVLSPGAYSRPGYVKLLHKRTGNIRYSKLK